MPTYGLEEEVFVCEPDRPNLKSLYYLAKLLWKNPRKNYIYTASNFSRGHDTRQGLMSGIEISTDNHPDIKAVIEDLIGRRRELDRAVEGLIVPLGSLINYNAPTNVCALQIHIGDVKDQQKVYNNLAYFLPVLTLLTINAPFADGQYFGQSFRIAKAYAIGPLKQDWTDRFQDIIHAKRLGTIELRVFDPTWDLKRIRILLEAIDAIAKAEKKYPLNLKRYNQWRERLAVEGYFDELKELRGELNEIYEIPERYLIKTCSDHVRDYYNKYGLVTTYSSLDSAYREGVFKPGQVRISKGALVKKLAGIGGYYMPKLPYIIWKYLREK